MILAVCMIFLMIDFLLVFGGMENNLLNQKISAAGQAQLIALNTAEAGIIAQQAKINGQVADLNHIQGELTDSITAEVLDECQQHIFTIVAAAVYQNARVKLMSAYLQARQPPLLGCNANQPSHQLWWQQVDF